jgi:rubrerythrin
MILCPKCRQPLEDADEPYICCAGTVLSWRCVDCGKVSEGFAFPYGQCPHCSGTLETLGQREIEGEAALKAVSLAFAIELGGQAFYAQAAAETSEPGLKDLFGRLAEMEGEHMTTLARRYHTEAPAPSTAFQTERAALFAGIDSRPGDPDNLLKIAIACEQRAVDFFAARGEEAAEGTIERQLYRELAAEEREHVALLTTELARFRHGKPGLL